MENSENSLIHKERCTEELDQKATEIIKLLEGYKLYEATHVINILHSRLSQLAVISIL